MLRSSADIYPDGAYEYAYETSNGISAQESGIGGKGVQGSAKWNTPDGTPIELTYIADENGYQPQGNHLPTPPPIPDAILRALAWIEAHPPKDDEFSYKHYEQQEQQRQAPAASPFSKPSYQQSAFLAKSAPAKPASRFSNQNSFNSFNSRKNVFG